MLSGFQYRLAVFSFPPYNVYIYSWFSYLIVYYINVGILLFVKHVNMYSACVLLNIEYTFG